MTLQLIINVAKAAVALRKVEKAEVQTFRTALHKASDQTSSEITRRGRADILRSGKFSSRWPDDLVAPVAHEPDKTQIQVKFLTIPYAHVHEFGATIRGRPLLWIPLPWTGITVRAREYPGRLFRVNRPGRNPLLLDDSGPKYVGVTHVTLRPRFHIRDITSNVVRTELSRFFYSVWVQ